jgi:hypothetical protein
MPRMRPLHFAPLLTLLFTACSDDSEKVVEQPLDCTTYCSQIMTNCTGDNAQYPDELHCTSTCEAFARGAASDTTGNTLGCRLYHAGAPAMMDPAMHCVHAGPGGDQPSAAGTCGDACTSFCTIEIAACGTKDAGDANAQYANMTACMQSCNGFPKTNAYRTTAKGDSLACRLYHATNAVEGGSNATMHCPHTAATPTGPCSGAASP